MAGFFMIQRLPLILVGILHGYSTILHKQLNFGHKWCFGVQMQTYRYITHLKMNKNFTSAGFALEI